MSVYVLASGGTGGHVFPALSVAFELEGHDLYFATDTRGIRFLGKERTFFKGIRVDLYKKVRFLNTYVRYAFLIKNFITYLFWLKKIKAECVIGFGGYPSVPCVWAAQILKIPTILHEQNANLGRANRFLSPDAMVICTSFESTKPNKKVSKAPFILTGNPTRPFLNSISDNIYTLPIDKDPFIIAVLSGSQGARLFSDVIPKALQKLPLKLQENLYIYHQCRKEDREHANELYSQTFIPHTIQPFFEDMDELYKKAHLIIARSGASTIAELLLVKRPSILIPYAQAIEQDQLFNARELEKNKGCFVFEESNLSCESFSAFLELLLVHKDQLIEQSLNLKKLFIRKAANNVANIAHQITQSLKKES